MIKSTQHSSGHGNGTFSTLRKLIDRRKSFKAQEAWHYMDARKEAETFPADILRAQRTTKLSPVYSMGWKDFLI